MPELFQPRGFTVAKKDVPVMRMGGYQAQWVEWGGNTIAFETVPGDFPPGGDRVWEGLPEDLCQCPHWGYILKGRAKLRFVDGTEVIINAGDLYYAPPGHKLYALAEGFENVEFNPAEPAKRTMDQFAAAIGRMEQEAARTAG